VSALAAADLAAFVAVVLERVLPAALAALALVVSLDALVAPERCESALPAADLAALLALGFERVLPAALAALLPVTSLRGI